MWLYIPDSPQPACDLRIAGFCSGVGMLDRAAVLALAALDRRAACVVHVEREVVAASVLVALEKAAGHAAPVWDDLATFDGRRWRGIVDIAVAGLPCPSFSSAGKRLGNDDPRAWGDADSPQPQFLRIVGEMRPAVVFLENVPEWVTGGHFRRFGEVLSNLGYEVQDPLFVTAKSVRAKHERERVFIMAIREGGGFRGLWQSSGSRGQPDGRYKKLALTSSTRREGSERCGVAGDEGAAARGPVAERGGVVGSAECNGRQAWDGYAGQGTDPEEGIAAGIELRRGSIPLFAPGKDDWAAWAAVAALDPAKMPAIESGVSVVADGLAVANSDLLRLGGNGVVVSQAALAFYELARRAQRGG